MEGFQAKFFYVNDYPGHKAIYNCIKNKLDGLVKEKKKREEEEEMARKALQIQ